MWGAPAPLQARHITGTAIARIFHGLSTAAFPGDQWRKCGFWGRYTAWDFRTVADVAGREVDRFFLLQEATDEAHRRAGGGGGAGAARKRKAPGAP